MKKIAIIGLGYVGLPLLVAFSKNYRAVGYDINKKRIEELRSGTDTTLEIEDSKALVNKNIAYTSELNEISDCSIYIVTVPTPVDKYNKPDLTPLIKASQSVGSVLSHGDIVIYESTVYPGATEEECVPILEQASRSKFNTDFFVGYSPERINPGDKERDVTTIKKVTSGSTPKIAQEIDDLYSSIITAGTFLASSIRVAEASKVIENVQRDVNIALINELSQIFDRLDIPTLDVIDAASTKWNFMKLTPGLVGGHCIGVDPYYLLHKAQSKGYIPDLMRTAREINSSMPSYVASEFLKYMISNKVNPIGIRVALLGFTFKENCPDIRNTKVMELYNELLSLGFLVDVVDPIACKKEVFCEYDITLTEQVENNYDASILAVGHDSILDLVKNNSKKLGLVYNFKGYTV